jgi:23S rRNA (cytosine1962-C5)-methyltransferase
MTSLSLTFPDIHDGEDKSSCFKNRIRKNYRHLRKWAKRTATNCFRLYDREIRYYPLAIDYYDGRFCVHYFSSSREDTTPPAELVQETNQALHDLFQAEPESIFWRSRIRRKKEEQYEKSGGKGSFFVCYEYGVAFRINLTDYLDTGLFLDHRETRQLVAVQARDKRLLNLFAYTSSFSVHAALAGARTTKSVDMSNTYNAWGRENFNLNKLCEKENEIIRADCLKFLDQEIRSNACYDLIVIDPPTLSRSKKMDQLFDIQRDYLALLSKALKLLASGGRIFFSTNSRKFVFDEEAFSSCSIRDISNKTLPPDFHHGKIHRCWTIDKQQ